MQYDRFHLHCDSTQRDSTWYLMPGKRTWYTIQHCSFFVDEGPAREGTFILKSRWSHGKGATVNKPPWHQPLALALYDSRWQASNWAERLHDIWLDSSVDDSVVLRSNSKEHFTWSLKKKKVSLVIGIKSEEWLWTAADVSVTLHTSGEMWYESKAGSVIRQATRAMEVFGAALSISQ